MNDDSSSCGETAYHRALLKPYFGLESRQLGHIMYIKYVCFSKLIGKTTALRTLNFEFESQEKYQTKKGREQVSIGRFNCMSMHAVELWPTLKLSKN